MGASQHGGEAEEEWLGREGTGLWGGLALYPSAVRISPVLQVLARSHQAALTRP